MSSKMLGRHFCRSQKYLLTHLRPFSKADFNADSESVFSFSLSCLELEKLELKVLQIIIIIGVAHSRCQHTCKGSIGFDLEFHFWQVMCYRHDRGALWQIELNFVRRSLGKSGHPNFSNFRSIKFISRIARAQKFTAEVGKFKILENSKCCTT